MSLQANNSFTPSYSSSSSSFNFSWLYDVFISFRGRDTRYGFTGNLYKSLSEKGIHTFIDDEELKRGDEITPSLVKAIQESRIAIIVFSENYASSSFCLDELATIMECVKGKGRLVLPVFYGVEPSDIRHQRKSYGEAMAKHEKRFKLDDMEKLQKWRQALRQAANLSGEDVKIGNNYEFVFIEKIVKYISTKINRAPLYVANYPVGLESQVQEVYSLLNDGFEGGVLMVGIHGIGGIGKSTLARSVYNLIADQFDGLCFLENVREKSDKHGLVHLQETLLSELLHEDIKLASVHQGIPIIKHRLCQKKILLVLDDIDKLEQLRALVGGNNWFGSGSRVIIITRDKQLLASHGIERTYDVKDLSEKEALVLLTWNAFKREIADPCYMDVLKRAITYACGLPLVLEVIGSNLCGLSTEEWKSALDQYERIPNKEIQKILQISFDALEEYQQKIFLDIVCCSLNGFNYLEVKQILQARHDVGLKYGLNMLVQKALIKIERYHFLKLHDLIQNMGKEIIRQESPKHPGNRSRLWLPNDVIHVLEESDGTSEIEIMILDAPKSEKVAVEWDGDAFKKMKSLEILIIKNACFSQSPKHLPNSLRVLEWWSYPSNSLPSDFHPNKLAIFKLPCSNLLSVGFVEKRKFMNLELLILDQSNIERIPEVSSVPNLKVLSFENCHNLIKVHESVGFLSKLFYLGVEGCSKLRNFPALKLPSLVQLNFSKCSSLENFPEILGDMKELSGVILNDTLIKELPFSFTNLKNLEYLEIRKVYGMLRLPSSIATLPSLLEVDVSESEGLQFLKQDVEEEEEEGQEESRVSFRNCNMLDESVAMALVLFGNVVELDLSKNNFTVLPETIKELCSLRKLNLDNCKKLKDIRGSPPNIKYFSAKNCTSLSPLSRSIILDEELHSSGRKTFLLPGNSIPKWFEHTSESNSISFWFRNKLPPFSLCVTGDIYLEAIINGKESFKHNCSLDKFFDDDSLFSNDSANHLTIFDNEEISFEEDDDWNHVVYVVDSARVKPVKIGIHIHKKENNMEDIRFTEPLQQKSLAAPALALFQIQNENWLSLSLPPAINSSNDDKVNGDFNSIELMQTSSLTSV